MEKSNQNVNWNFDAAETFIEIGVKKTYLEAENQLQAVRQKKRIPERALVRENTTNQIMDAPARP